MNSRTKLVAATILATALAASPVLAETTGGATLAGGDNGAAAKADANAQARTPTTSQGDATKGSPAATPAPGQSTEHSDGTMRGKKNF